MEPNPQFPADLVTFTKEILNEKLFCAVSKAVMDRMSLGNRIFKIRNQNADFESR